MQVLLRLKKWSNKSGDVCFWHKADTAIVPSDVRFRG